MTPLETYITEKKLKKFDGGNCRIASIVYAARCKIHGDIYISSTGEELKDSTKTDTIAR